MKNGGIRKMASEFNYKGVCALIGLILILICLMTLILSAGCITASKNIYIDITATPAPTPTPEPTPVPTIEIITPEPTPAAIEIQEDYVDPYASGERNFGQWFKFYRADVQGLKDLDYGIIAYRWRFLDRYTWYNAAQGNYFTERAPEGSRFVAIWVRQETFGTNISDDSSFWVFEDKSFALQVKDKLVPQDASHNPVNLIKEFDDYTDYTNTITAPPHNYYIKYTGHNPATGGFAAEKIGVIRMGPGNAIDGYLLYIVPKDTQVRDMIFLGNFGTFGSAQWKFPEK
jgi:hypothetical protein